MESSWNSLEIPWNSLKIPLIFLVKSLDFFLNPEIPWNFLGNPYKLIKNQGTKTRNITVLPAVTVTVLNHHFISIRLGVLSLLWTFSFSLSEKHRKNEWLSNFVSPARCVVKESKLKKFWKLLGLPRCMCASSGKTFVRMRDRRNNLDWTWILQDSLTESGEIIWNGSKKSC